MKKYIHTLYHSVLVGVIAAGVIVVSGWLQVLSWVAFFAWANYFLHAGAVHKSEVFRKSYKMLVAFFIGIFLALLGIYAIGYLKTIVPNIAELYVVAFVVFFIATILIFLEIIQNWGDFIPATFLGTVLVFSTGVTFITIWHQLLVPILVGMFAGYTTIATRRSLEKILNR